MNINELKDMHWLLLVSKNNLNYKEQKESWNRIAQEWRAANKKAGEPIKDLLLRPLNVHEGVYTD